MAIALQDRSNRFAAAATRGRLPACGRPRAVVAPGRRRRVQRDHAGRPPHREGASRDTLQKAPRTPCMAFPASGGVKGRSGSRNRRSGELGAQLCPCPAPADNKSGHGSLPRLDPKREDFHDAGAALRQPHNGEQSGRAPSAGRDRSARAPLRVLPGNQALEAASAPVDGCRAVGCRDVRIAAGGGARGADCGARRRTPAPRGPVTSLFLRSLGSAGSGSPRQAAPRRCESGWLGEGQPFRLARKSFPYGRDRQSPGGPERSGGPAKRVDCRARPCVFRAQPRGFQRTLGLTAQRPDFASTCSSGTT